MMTAKLRQAPLVLAICSLAGCAEFSNGSPRFDNHFGEAVRQMRIAQTYNPDTRSHPSAQALLTHDGKKQEAILNGTYRQDVWQLESKRRDTDTVRYFSSDD